MRAAPFREIRSSEGLGEEEFLLFDQLIHHPLHDVDSLLKIIRQ